MSRTFDHVSLLVLAGLLAAGCSSSSPHEAGPPGAAGGGGDQPVPDGVAIARSKLERNQNPDVPEADRQALAASNTAFALDLYQSVRQPGENLLLAPYSISTALAMAYAGARSETASQMAGALHFGLPQARLHGAMNQLDLELDSRSVRLDTVNQSFAQQGYAFLDGFLDVLATDYGAGMMLVDFETHTEDARSTINGWFSDQTQRKISELVPPGILNSNTRLVLANAIYFKADWLNAFDPAKTEQGTFAKADGSSVDVPMMHEEVDLGYAEGEGWQAVEIPYSGKELTMLAILPAVGSEGFDLELDADGLSAIVDAIEEQKVALSMPRLKFACPTDLKEPLKALGMTDAFDPIKADLSGMNGEHDLYVEAALHQATIEVNEQGTEASGATAVVVGTRGVASSPKAVSLDRPFVVLIRDVATGTVLFLGRVADPS
ncbi:MAG: serpin family protein [Polyangiaceae bacterium]|nr:serpin family protein [Polyangiaceae bacterium]